MTTILFYLFLGSFIFGQLLRFQLGSSVAVTINELLLCLLVGAWLIAKKPFKIVTSSYLFKPFAIFILVCIVSLLLQIQNLLPEQLLIASLYIVRFILYSALFFIVKDFSPLAKKRAAIVLFGIGILVVLEGFVQYIFYQNLRNLFYLGWDDHLYRMFSVFLDPNFAAAYFVLFSTLTAGLLLNSIVRKNRFSTVLYGLSFLVTVSALFLTHSRSGLIMFVVSIFTFLMIIGRMKIMIPIIIVIVGVMVFSSQFFYIENINLFRIASSEARLESAQNAISIFSKNPILGVGYNAYRYAQIQYGFREGPGAVVSHADAGTDNSFLFVLATTGVIGLIAYLYLWWKIMRSISFKNKKFKDFAVVLQIVCFASVVGIFVDSLFINSLFYPALLSWVFILVGLSYSNKSKENK